MLEHSDKFWSHYTLDLDFIVLVTIWIFEKQSEVYHQKEDFF